MKHMLRVFGLSATLLYACQRPADTPTPLATTEQSRVAARPTKCDQDLTIKIRSSFKDFDRLYLFEAMYVGRNGKDSAVAASTYQDLINNNELVFENLAYNKTVRVRFYENDQSKTKFLSSGTFPSCGKSSAQFDLSSFKPATTPTPVKFQVKFPCNDVDQKKLPDAVPVEFRQTGTSAWFPLMTLNRQQVKKNLLEAATYRVIKGSKYDVRINVYGAYLTQNATTLTKDVWEVPVTVPLFCK